MTRPEKVLALPLRPHPFRGNVLLSKEIGQRVECESDGEAAALVTMCNAYPLALALAETVDVYLGMLAAGTLRLNDRALTAHRATHDALLAFLAHRQEADR